MKPLLLIIVAALQLNLTPVKSQSLVFDTGSNGFNCFPFGMCAPQPNYDVAANSTTGHVYLLKHEIYSIAPGSYVDKIIRFNETGSRMNETNLPIGHYGKLFVDGGNGVYVLYESNDSVIVTNYDQQTLVKKWSTGILGSAGTPEPVDICHASGFIFFGYNDSAGVHLVKLNKTSGAIAAAVTYHTNNSSFEHAVDMEVSNSKLYLTGYIDRPGAAGGDKLWVARFSGALIHQWDRFFDKTTGLTNNSDRGSHIHIVNDTIYVSGTVQGQSGNKDAILFKFATSGKNIWQRIVNKGFNDHTVDCAVDKSNGDVYLLQNALTNVNTIFVTRFDAAGNQLWSNGYASTDTTGAGTRGNNIYADTNPDGKECEIYVTGQREDYGGEPHGSVNGSNNLAYKYNRNGVLTEFYAPDASNGPTGLAPLIGIQKSVYYPDYMGRPNLFMISDGDISNPTVGVYGWKLLSWDISSVARIEGNAPFINNQENMIRVFPNPASDVVHVFSGEDMQSIVIYDLAGQVVKNISLSLNEVTFNVSDLKRGMYFMQASVNGVLSTRRLIVQ